MRLQAREVRGGEGEGGPPWGGVMTRHGSRTVQGMLAVQFASALVMRISTPCSCATPSRVTQRLQGPGGLDARGRGGAGASRL